MTTWQPAAPGPPTSHYAQKIPRKAKQEMPTPGLSKQPMPTHSQKKYKGSFLDRSSASTTN